MTSQPRAQQKQTRNWTFRPGTEDSLRAGQAGRRFILRLSSRRANLGGLANSWTRTAL